SPPTSTLFPYTTLFRSHLGDGLGRHPDRLQCRPGDLVLALVVVDQLLVEVVPRPDQALGALGVTGVEGRQRVDEPVEVAPERARSEEHTSELQSQSNLV